MLNFERHAVKQELVDCSSVKTNHTPVRTAKRITNRLTVTRCIDSTYFRQLTVRKSAQS